MQYVVKVREVKEQTMAIDASSPSDAVAKAKHLIQESGMLCPTFRFEFEAREEIQCRPKVGGMNWLTDQM